VTSARRAIAGDEALSKLRATAGRAAGITKGFALSVQIASTTEAERIFHELSEEGSVSMPLERAFWAERFGALVDRFGIPWLINCEGSEQPSERSPR
jgi:PhnB protein